MMPARASFGPRFRLVDASGPVHAASRVQNGYLPGPLLTVVSLSSVKSSTEYRPDRPQPLSFTPPTGRAASLAIERIADPLLDLLDDVTA
ncbi:hypothetical protein GCM10009717_06090 [Agromyces allii]|uniref:Uncharacterized protein n=1 Tax=Agromyces allii TaxID=393607 RepID=A0ABN2Q2K3_9MICO